MKKENKVITFVKNHKKEIAFATITLVVGTVMLVVARKKPDIPNTVIEPKIDWKKIMDEKIKNLNWSVGTVTDLWNEFEGSTDLIINDITVSNLGDLGEECLKIDGITSDTKVSMVLSLLTNTDET